MCVYIHVHMYMARTIQLHFRPIEDSFLECASLLASLLLLLVPRSWASARGAQGRQDRGRDGSGGGGCRKQGREEGWEGEGRERHRGGRRNRREGGNPKGYSLDLRRQLALALDIVGALGFRVPSLGLPSLGLLMPVRGRAAASFTVRRRAKAYTKMANINPPRFKPSGTPRLEIVIDESGKFREDPRTATKRPFVYGHSNKRFMVSGFLPRHSARAKQLWPRPPFIHRNWRSRKTVLFRVG